MWAAHSDTPQKPTLWYSTRDGYAGYQWSIADKSKYEPLSAPPTWIKRLNRKTSENLTSRNDASVAEQRV